jgi:hypothetical protein
LIARLVITVLSSLCAMLCALVAAGPAQAAPFDVASCSGGGMDDAWTGEVTDGQALERITACPSQTGRAFDGLQILDRLMGPDAALGDRAQLQFDAPDGTTIARVRLWRSVGKAANAWELYTRTAAGTKLPNSDCTRPVDQFTC